MATIDKIPFFIANVKDEPGTLLKIMYDLKARNLSLSGLWGFGTNEGKAQLFVVAKDSEVLRKAWNNIGLYAEEGTGFFVRGEDRIGALIDCLERLVKANINIHAIDAIAIEGLFGSFIWVEACDVEKAAIALGAI